MLIPQRLDGPAETKLFGSIIFWNNGPENMFLLITFSGENLLPFMIKRRHYASIPIVKTV